MRGGNGRDALRVAEIEVRRTPGMPSGFRITGLSPGLNLVYGPNASGKTTTARVIHGLLWPDVLPDGWSRAAFGGALHLGNEQWRIDYDAGHATYQRNGVNADPLRVAVPDDHRDRYLLSLHDLLREEDAGGPLAEVIVRESAGGYDVPRAIATLGYRASPPRGGRPPEVVERVRAAQQAVRVTREGYEHLRREEARLDELRERAQRAMEARDRAALLEQALAYAAARRTLDEARERLATFPEVLARLHGDEDQRLERIEANLTSARQRRAEAEQALQRAEADARETGLMGHELPPGFIERLRGLYAELQDLASEIRQAEAAYQEALTQRTEARRRIDPGLTDEQIAALDRDGLDAFVQATSELARVMAAEDAERQLQAWVGSGKAVEDLQRLQQGIGLLSQWLRTPAPHDEGEQTGAIRAGVAAALLVTAEGALLGLLVHPALWVLAVVGIGLLIVIRRRPVDTDAAAVRENIQREFLRLELGRPAAWETEEVEKLFDQLIARLQAAALEHERAQRWAGLAPRRAELAAARLQAEARREGIRQRYGLIVDGDVARLALLASNVAAWQRANDEVVTQESARDLSRTRFRDALARLNGEFERFGYSEAADLPSAAGYLEDLAARVERLRQATDQAARARQALEDASHEIARLEDERRALLEPLGLSEDDPRALYEWLRVLDDYRNAVRAVTDAEAVVSVSASALAEHPDLLDATAEALRQELHEQQLLAAELESITREIGGIERRISEARRQQDLERALAEQDDAMAALRAARERDYALAAGAVLGEFVQERTRDGTRPRVFHRAREIFAGITRGRYHLEFQDESPPAFRATDTGTGIGQSLEELSSATRLQLLMAVRLAFIEEAEHGPRLPLLLDETLGNSDEQRARAIIDATIEICRAGRQVFYFTAQHDEVSKWRAILREHPDLPHAVHDLTEIRGLADYERLPLADPVPLRTPVPAPGDMTREEYGRALRVPGIDPLTSHIGGVHLWYLVTDLDTLHRLLEHGIATWGQAENLAARGVLDSLLDNPVVYQRAAARARVLAAVLDAVRIGGGKPVDRAVLLDSGAISATFIDRVTDLAREKGGDAKALVTALRDRVIPGFQQRKLDELHTYLAEQGYLDERERLSPEQIRTEALAAGGPDLQAGNLTPADIDDLLGHVLVGAD